MNTNPTRTKRISRPNATRAIDRIQAEIETLLAYPPADLFTDPSRDEILKKIAAEADLLMTRLRIVVYGDKVA